MKNTLYVLFCALLSLTAAATQAETLSVELGGERFQLEVVDDPASREQGLMGRERLAADQGMLFDFPVGTRPAIWMRNMQISLDLLYVDSLGRLVQVFPAVPPCKAMPCDVYRANRPLRFVIEVPAGTIERLGLAVGDQLDLAGRQRQPAPAE